jgi:hypothetical protein
MKAENALRTIKLVHTVIWAFFAACILAMPVFAYAGNVSVALGLAAVVTIEVVILVFNRWRCPLTGVAGRYTDQRRDNFDIYLPVWLARYNKLIFGTLFVVGVLYTMMKWWSVGA